MTRIHLRRVAKRDLRQALAWYAQRNAALATRFLDEVYKALSLLEQFPNTGGPVHGINEPAIRQLPVDTFPYQVIFRRFADRIAILAIAHERRRPGYWDER